MTKTSTTVMKLDDRLRVAASPALFADLKALLGPNCSDGLMPDSSRAAARDVAAVLGVSCRARGAVRCLVVAGGDARGVHQAARRLAMNETALGKQFGADGWYAVIAATAGVLAGVVLTWWRSRDALWTAALLVLGALVAAVLMALVGHLLGPADPRDALAAAKVGTKVPESLGLGVLPLTPVGSYLKETAMFYLAWPVGALAGCLAVLLVRVPVSSASAEDPADEPTPESGPANQPAV